MKKILVIGGYGQVGSRVCDNLLKMEKSVIVAGRDIKKCENYAKKSNFEMECRQLDVSNWSDQYLEQVETVVMCLEMNNMEVLEGCIRNKVNYVDITPTGALIEQIKERKEAVLEAGIAVCVGVGIAPGVSNVLCETLAEQFDVIEVIDSYIMLGIGESHGKNAVLWLVNNLNVVYDENLDKQHKVRSFSDGRNVILEGKEKHRFVRIDMADWHIMKEKHREAKVNSWYAYDKNSITILFEILQKVGILRLLKSKTIKTLFEKFMEFNMKVMKKIHYGTDRYAIMVEIRGRKDGKTAVKRDRITGSENCLLTAKMCALTAVRMSEMTAGFYYMDEIIDRTMIS